MKHMHISNKKYAIASILSPIIAGVIIYTYQSITYSEIWNSINNANATHNTEGAMMGIAEAIEMIVALAIGSFIGIILAIKSIHININKIGVIALVLNIFPLLLLSFFWLKGILHGI